MTDDAPTLTIASQRKSLEIVDLKAKLGNVNLRTEKHGDDDVLACDLKLKAEVDKSTLDLLAIVPHDYWSETNDAVPLGMFEAIKLDVKHENLRVTVSEDYPEAVKEAAVILAGATLDKVQFVPRSHRSAEVQFRVRCEVSSEQCGELASLLNRDVILDIERRQSDLMDDAA